MIHYNNSTKLLYRGQIQLLCMYNTGKPTIQGASQFSTNW